MMNPQHSRILTTLALVAALSVALGSEALASSPAFSSKYSASVWQQVGVAKPGVAPMTGEPDSPTAGPLPPKIGPGPSAGRPTSADWALRLQWVLRNLLLQTPKRFP